MQAMALTRQQRRANKRRQIEAAIQRTATGA